jgi:putative OPT family oligopeptide transporter
MDPSNETLVPHPTEPYREFTAVAAVFGVLLGAVMTAAFCYVALRLGFTLPGSTVAAILGFAVLRGLLKKGSIIENNINQTVASGVNNASAGISFTLPALFLLYGTEFNMWAVFFAAIAGSFLGIVVIIPLRKQMIEFERLRFPSGIAVAALLKSPGAGIRQAQLLGGGFAISAGLHLLAGFGWFPEELGINGLFAIPAWLPIVVGVSFASLGAGLLSGRGGLPFVLGGVLAWWVIAPSAVLMGWVPALETFSVVVDKGLYTDWMASELLYAEMLRPLGIGILIGGALSGVVASFPALKSAISSLSNTSRVGGASSDEMPVQVMYGGVIVAFLVLFGAAVMAGPTLGLGRQLLIAVVGTLWLGLAGLIVAQATGMTDISPMSGMSLIGVTLMFFLTGGEVIPAIVLGVAVCVGIGQCADMMGDLKSGHLIGARPKSQQLAQFAVAWMGIPVAIAVITLLWGDGGGFGPDNPALSAPQGTALAAIMESLQAGAAPLDKYAAGTAIGLGLGLFPISGVGVLVGLAMYLPFSITMTYGVGCFVSMGLKRAKGETWMGEVLVPVAAGFIIGEALTSLGLVLGQLAWGFLASGGV